MLSQVMKPKNKSELIKRLNSLKNIEIEIIEPVTRQSLHQLKPKVDRFVGNGDINIILIKSK